MITVPGLASEALGSYLSTHLSRRFHSTEAHLTELIPSIARLSLECIGNSDALYHNVEHTMLVTLVGYDPNISVPGSFEARIGRGAPARQRAPRRAG